MPSPMRLFRPDFRTIFKNLSNYERELRALTMDSVYDEITKTVDDKSLDEADTARLVQKYMFGADQPEKCFEVIMGAIWPPPPKHCFIIFDSAKLTDSVSAPNLELETLVEGVECALGVNTNPANDVKAYKVFQVIDSNSTIAMEDDHMIIEKEGRAVPLRGQLCGQLPITQSGGSYHAKQDATTANFSDAPINANTTNSATQTSHSTSVPNPPANHHFTRNINYYPMPSGRELKRAYAMTELSLPDAHTIVLGPPPPPTLPPHVRTSTLPPGHPPQSYGPGAFPPFYNIPGASSGNANSGAASGITKEVASGSSTRPAQSPDLSENSKKRSRDDQDDKEEATLPSARPRIEAPPQSSNGEGSGHSGSPKKRVRYAEEEIACPSTRVRQESRPRYPSPTPSDRRIGRIIAPLGTSTRFNPRPSDIGPLGTAHNEGNSPDNLPASSSGSLTRPLASSDSSSASRSSRRIKQRKARDVSKKE